MKMVYKPVSIQMCDQVTTSTRPGNDQHKGTALSTFLLILAFLFTGVGSVWGETVTFDSWSDLPTNSTGTTNGSFVKSPVDGSTFTFGGAIKRYCEKNKESNTHYYLSKNEVGEITWTQPTGYTIAIEAIQINAFVDKPWLQSAGKLYLWPSNETSCEVKVVSDDEDNNTNSSGLTKYYVYNSTYTYSNGSTGYLFPNGNKLGVSDKFNLKATSQEARINWITLTYTLTPVSYTITLDNESPTSAGSTSVSLTYDSNTHAAITNPTKDDYTFGGWWTGDNGTGTLVIDAEGNLQANVEGYTGAGGIWKKDATTTLYAKWISNATTITLNNQSATTAGTTSISVLYNKDNNLTGEPAITIPTKTNHTFEGYYTAVNGDGLQIIAANGNVNAGVSGYTDGDKKWQKETDVTLYAYWKQNQTITWTQDFGSPIRSNVITLSASASSPLGVSYEVTANADKVELEGNTLTCLKAGTVTIRAYHDGNESWNAIEMSRNITIAEHAITTLPTASGTLTYEQTLDAISPTGGVANVAGSWAWKYPSSVPAAGTANQVAVFTPSSSIISAYPLECNVSVTVNKATPDVICEVASTYLVDEANKDLQNLWRVTDASNGTVNYTVESFEAAEGNHEGATAPAIIENRYLSLGQAGTLIIRMSVAEGTNYLARTGTKTITINRRTPVYTWDGKSEETGIFTFTYPFNSEVKPVFATSSGKEVAYTAVSDSVYTANMEGDSLYVFNVAEEAHITVSQPETYKWNAHSKTYTITPVAENKHVPFTLSEANKSTFQYEGLGGDAATWNGTGYKFSDGNWGVNKKDGWAILNFDGVPGEIKFITGSDPVTTLGTHYPNSGDYLFEVYECATSDGDWGDPIWQTDNNKAFTESDYYNKTISVSLQPTTRYVKLRYYGSCWGKFDNIQVTEGVQFETDPATEFDFGLQGQNYGKQEEVINFYHANAGRVTTARILDGTDAEYFSVTPAEISGTGRDIVGSNTLIVSFDNKTVARAENEYYEADLYISDNAGNETTLRLKGRRHGKSYPKFTFNPNHVPYYFNDTIHNIVASTNTEAKIDVTSSDNSIAEIVDGKLVIKDKKAEVTITVSQEEIGDFRAHEQEFKFTPHEEPPLVVPFIMSKAIYDDAAMVISKGEDVSWTEDGCIRSGWSDWQATASGRYFSSKKEFVVAFSGVPDKLSFKAKNTYASINCRWKVEQRSEGGDWQTVFYKSQSCQDWVEFTDIQLDPTAQYLRFQYGGNYTGYFKDIQVSCIDGVKYMLAGDGQYLSRGGEYGTRAIVDEFGLPIKVTRSTTDNETYTTQVQFLDSRQYLYEAGGTYVYTDNKVAGSNATKWRQIVSDGKVKVQSANSREEGDRFITVVNGNLTMTADAEAATIWEVEDYTIHAERIEAKLNRRAAEAAYHDFGEEMNTMEKVRAMLEEEDFDYTSIEIDAVSPTEQKGEYRDPSGAFAVYDQEITDLEPGFYRLKVQALYKPSPSPIDWENHAKGYESVVSYVYANDFKFPIKSVYDITGRHTALVSGDTLCGGYYYPANLASATTAFTDLNTYMHDLYVYVEADEDSETGTLRYGIVNQSYVPGVWMAYGGFILEKIARKTYIFDGGTEGTGTTWGTAANWDYQNGRESVPGEKNAVVIKSDVEVTGQFKVFSIEVHDDAKVSIAPTGGLTIGAGGVKYITSKKSAPTSIVLEAEITGENKGKTGFLRVSPDYSGELPEVEVQLYSVGYYDRASEAENVASWQHVGCPIEFEGKLAKTVFTRSWIYSYQEANDKWVNNRSTLVMQPFVGYATTQYDDVAGKLLTFSGKLLPSDSVYTVDLAYTDDAHGHNMVANSFAAPIDITNFKDADFVNAEKTIYIFNTGTRQNYLDDNAVGNSAGQWTAIPIRSLSEMNTFFAENTSIPSTIAPMQGFCVNATGAGAKMVFDYNRLVWNADYSTHQPKPMRSPKRALAAQEEEQPITGAMKISVEAEGWSDDVYMLESERYSYEYEDGYDARKMESGNFNIFTVRDGEQLAIDANPDFEGTQIGVRTGEATAYTMHFSNLFGEREWALVDVEAEETIDIREGTEYTFFIEPNSTNLSRFYLIEQHSQAPAVTTGVDNAEDDAKVHKFIKDDKLFILKSGVLYDATGARVK